MNLTSNENFEDRVISELLDRLNDDGTPSVGDSGESSQGQSDELIREYLEVLGLLAYDLEPAEPSPAVKEKLMSAIEGDLSADPKSTVDPIEPSEGAKVIMMPDRKRPSWALPLAASFAFALLGFSIWQSNHLTSQKGTIEDLAGRLHDANRQIADATDYRASLRKAESNLALVSSPGVEVCALHPADAELSQEDARGTLFVAANHNSWYLRLDGLVPCPLGRKHQIWFVKSDGTAESGGVFDVKPGEGIEVTSDIMPTDTVAVMITLEPEGGSVEPTGPSVLYGDDVMRIL